MVFYIMALNFFIYFPPYGYSMVERLADIHDINIEREP